MSDSYDDFHYVNNFPNADQIKILIPDTSKVDSLNRSFSSWLSLLDKLTRVNISAKQADKVLAHLDETNILLEKVIRKQKKIDRE